MGVAGMALLGTIANGLATSLAEPGKREAALITFLVTLSGVTLLEQDIAERRPQYRDYVLRTNAFFPGPPKAGS